MTVRAIVGLQWGDEGKGKISDLFAASASHVVRAQGGPNAGHTVEVGPLKLKLHQIPSGAAHPHVHCYLGAGMVIDPEALLQEVQLLKEAGIEVEGRLHISHFAHLILPKHREQEKILEKKQTIGTTKKGIGPAYADRALRVGKKAKESEKLAPYLADVETLLHQALFRNEEILLEGAQGALLDNTFGTYPYVTSSCTLSSGLCSGSGIPPTALSEVIGVAKAYTTRVGEGPFPTEGDIGIGAKEAGEFGVTTGRARRMGWFNGCDVKWASALNGCDKVVLTKLDILDPLEEIKVAIGYGGSAGEKLPIYETLKGWKTPTDKVRDWEGLPENARRFVERIEALIECPISLISVGPDRNATLKCP